MNVLCSMSVGARINRMGKGFIGNEAGKVQYGGWSHIVNLVTIRGDVFVVDVGVSGKRLATSHVPGSADDVLSR